VNPKESEFLKLVESNKGILFKICRIYQDNAEDQDDLLQEITMQLWLAFDSFRGDSKFTSWMYRVALNTAIAFFKKQKRRPDNHNLPEGFDKADKLSDAGEQEDQLAMFYRAVRQLNKIEKALVYLYMENQSYEEIATHLGITPVNARVRMSRLKDKLKEITKKIDYEYR
jgi:RNA polymerase sigma-70 factor (ECF subfamily)